MPDDTTDRVQRIRQIFGEVLPTGTTDDHPDPADMAADRAADRTMDPTADRTMDPAADPAAEARDRWLRDNRPPHHDSP